jgi:hypothetical protein
VRAFFRVAQHLVRLIDFLEAVLGLFVVGVVIGMMLFREFAVRLADFVVTGFPVDAEDFVVILVFHRMYCYHRAGCTSRTRMQV